ncbi:MAG: PilZ domain-containing protein, partial [Vulcanimicrobiaceae bacterium]
MRTATQRRLNELEWAMVRLLRAPREVRRSKRQFGVTTSTDGGMTFVNAYPVDISVDGVALISTEEIETRKMLVTIDLDNKRIQALAQCVSAQKGTLKGNIVWRIGARFIQIAREDRTLIDRFVKRLPLTPPKPQQQHGLFPDNVINKILHELVAIERLAPLRHGKQPLVKMTHVGVIQRAKQTMHSVKVESRVVREGTTT